MIWKIRPSMEKIQLLRKNTMLDFLGIEFTEIGDDYLSGRMPVDNRTRQPYGIMHGGASCVLAESLGSVAGLHCLDPEQFFCVGLDINTSHIRKISSGFVDGTARPIHLGKMTQVWEIRIVNDEKQLISLTRLTLAVLPKNRSL